MKIFTIFPIILEVIFNIPTFAGIVIQPTVNPFETVSFSPLYYDKDSTIVHATKAGLSGLKIYICNDYYQDQLIYSNTFTKSGKHTIHYNNEYTRSNNEIYFKYLSGRTWRTTDKIAMSPVTEGYKYLVDNQSFESRGNISVFAYETRAWSTHKVNYSFANFDDLYMPDYYHKIRLDDFQINIASDDRLLFHCTPSLVISNVDGVFNDISTNSSVEFQLKTVTTSSGYAFQLKDTLYVHKETLMMSSTPKDGYVATRHIYLPRNEMSKQDKYKAYFALQNFGIDYDFVKHNFELRALKNIIGDCQNSEYCIQRL